MDAPLLADAFENAIRQVDRALAGEMRTATGEPARPMLERLRADLEAHRETARVTGTADPEWVRGVVRWVAEWTPETELTLIAALGRIARAGVHPTGNGPVAGGAGW